MLRVMVNTWTCCIRMASERKKPSQVGRKNYRHNHFYGCEDKTNGNHGLDILDRFFQTIQKRIIVTNKKAIYWLSSLFIVISMLFSTTLVAHATGNAVPLKASVVTFKPVADAYVIQTSVSNNYGSSTSLRVDASPVTRSFLRFTVTGLNGAAVQSAVLRIFANSASTTGFSVRAVATNSWVENQITYANAPAVGNTINSSKAFATNTWVSVDISTYIKAAGTYSLALTTTNSTNTNLAAREAGANAPQLVLTTTTLATATATLQATKTTAPTATPTRTLVPSNTPTKTPTPVPSSTPTATGGSGWQPTFPIRAAFYYPWFPEAWTQQGIYPYTNYTPKLGYYSNADQNILKQHIGMMQYGNIQAGIASWWGQGSQTDTKIAGLLTAASGTNFRWALYYENESLGDPSVSQIQNDLNYIQTRYGKDPSFLKVNGKFVVFVYADANDGCGMADRWKQANTMGAYVVLKVFAGYASCASQPDSWHQYCPAVAADQQGSMSYTISPGFWLKGNAERLARDITRWGQNVRDMVASGANWQLVTTFSEWGEGTVVEPATEWASASGYGQYLDLLHTNGK